MSRNDSWKNTEEAGIDLAELLRRICIQWKWLIAAGLACAVLACGYGFVKSRESVPEEKLTEVPDIEITEEEQQEVENTVQTAKEAQQMKEYMEESVLMQINPYRKNSVVSLYSIDGAVSRKLTEILEGYLNFLTNGGVTSALKKADARKWKMESCYLEELIQAWERAGHTYRIDDGTADSLEGTLLYVKVVGKDAKMALQLAEDIQDALEDYSTVLKKESGRHRLSLVNRMESVSIDSSLQTQQHDKQEALKGKQAALKASLDALSQEQRAVYGLEEEEYKEKDRIQNNSAFQRKYVLLGFAGGVFLYCIIYSCWYLLSGTIKSVSEFRLYYNIPFYGSMSVAEKQDGKNGQGKERLLNRLQLLCRKQGIQKLCLAAGFALDRQEQEYMEEIARGLLGWGIEAVQAVNINMDVKQWEVLSENGHVLMVCRMGTTTHKAVDEEMEFYLENGIDVLGAVMFENRGCRNG